MRNLDHDPHLILLNFRSICYDLSSLRFVDLNLHWILTSTVFLRFEHREENRKDCLRTLFSLIEEAGKANKLVEDAQTLYVKERLRANPQFMERLRSKKMSSQVSSPQPA